MKTSCAVLTNDFEKPNLGVGVGLRSPHYEFVLTRRPAIPWFEATSENYMGVRDGFGGRPLEVLEKVRENYPIMLHGVSMNIGSTDPLSLDYFQKLRKLADRIEPVFVSDHLCWTGVGGENLHDLLPLPFTEESVSHVVARIRQAQDLLGRRLVFENVSSYLQFGNSELSEWEFLCEIAARADCGILLDVNNVYVSAMNQGFDAADYIHGVPKDRVAYMHVAGYEEGDGLLIDTHDHPVTPPVWNLYAESVKRFGNIPTLIEWDAKLPAFEVLQEEARKAEAIRADVLKGAVYANVA